LLNRWLMERTPPNSKESQYDTDNPAPKGQ
jgi:hypothetical protein